MSSDPPTRAPPEGEADPADVEDLGDEYDIEVDETTDPSIQRDILLAVLAEAPAERPKNPLADIAQAARENPDAVDAMFDSLRLPSLPPPPPEPPPEHPEAPYSIPPVLRVPEDEEDDPDEAEFYSRVTGIPLPPPKPKS
ncbi:MAG TPA: hypothetical protein VMU11_03995 [Verrucomicrobiae bacterium]|nr:hypothetical protein [Verrucomicrobiae bacterium]